LGVDIDVLADEAVRRRTDRMTLDHTWIDTTEIDFVLVVESISMVWGAQQMTS
jgi:hypothetical protein